MTGGEPLLHPDFVELCETITKTNKIRFDTNLSLTEKVRDFAQKIDPAQVYSIYAALHIKERERRNEVESFVENVLMLKKRNFNIRVNYILIPNLIDRFKSDYEQFKTRGIILEPKPFTGLYNTITRRHRHYLSRTPNYFERYFIKRYPDSYSENEIEILMELNPNSHIHTAFHSKDMDCSAGRTSLYMGMNGNMQKCPSNPKVVGSAFSDIVLQDKNEPCEVSMCLSYYGSWVNIPEIINRRDKKWTSSYRKSKTT